jgi:hypothetical protein
MDFPLVVGGAHGISKRRRAQTADEEPAGMPIIDSSALLIPYGTPQWSTDKLSLARSGNSLSVECAVPYVIAGAGVMLRLNGGQYEFAGQPPLGDLRDAAAQLGFLGVHLQRYCSLWDRGQKLFLDRYFEFIALRIERESDELKAKIAEFGSLYRYEDWVFSALRPLPQAWLNTTAGDYDPAALIGVDFAFWTGGEIVAVYITGTETAGPQVLEQRDHLRRTGVTVLEIPQSALAGSTTFAALLPGPFHNFWEGQTLPCGPFGATALSAFDPAL